MRELLIGTKRLPGFSGEWQAKLLGEVGHFLKGRGVAKDESLSGSIHCVRYGEIYTRHSDYIKEFYSWISRDVAATATQLMRGDILFAGSGETKEEIGKCVAFVDDVEAYAGGDIVILRPTNAYSLFLGYYLNTEPVRRQKASRGQGGCGRAYQCLRVDGLGSRMTRPSFAGIAPHSTRAEPDGQRAQSR